MHLQYLTSTKLCTGSELQGDLSVSSQAYLLPLPPQQWSCGVSHPSRTSLSGRTRPRVLLELAGLQHASERRWWLGGNFLEVIVPTTRSEVLGCRLRFCSFRSPLPAHFKSYLSCSSCTHGVAQPSARAHNVLWQC